jgi:ABC-type branched-subunit amino acid transport system substrate-binding protein
MKISSRLAIASRYLFALAAFCGLLTACALTPPPIPGQPGDSAETQALFQAAEAHFAAGEYDAAIEGYNAYILKAPQGRWVAGSLMKIGAANQNLERPLDALGAYRRLLTDYADAPFATDAYLQMLELYARAQRFDQILTLAPPDNGTEWSPGQRVHLFTLRGDAYLALGHPADAYVQYRAATGVSGDGALPSVAVRLEESVRQLNLAENQLFLEGEDQPAVHALLTYYLGVHQAEAGQYDNAVETLSGFAGRYPDHAYIDSAYTLMEEFSHHHQFTPYTIGCLLPLSGPYAAYGKRALEGIELALSDWSTHNWFPFRLVIRDSHGESEAALAELDALAKEGVGAVIGPMVTAEVVAPKAQEMGLPIIVMTQKEAITDIGSYIFRNFMTPEMQMQALGTYAVETLGLKRFAILYPQEPYGRRFMQQFWRSVAALGGAVTAVEAYDPKKTDFAGPIKNLIAGEIRPRGPLTAPALIQDPRHQAYAALGDGQDTLAQYLFTSPTAWIMDGYRSSIQSASGTEAMVEMDRTASEARFEAIFLPDAPRKAGLIIPQLAYYDIRYAQLLGTNLWHSQQLLEMARKYVQGAIFTDGVFFDHEPTDARTGALSDPVGAFKTAFKNTYASEPDLIAATAYDTAEILFSIFAEPEIRLRRDVKNRLRQAGPFPGITGTTTFSPDGEAQKALHLLQIQGRRFFDLAQLVAPPIGPLPTDPPAPQEASTFEGASPNLLN